MVQVHDRCAWSQSLSWIGSALKDLRAFPEEVKDGIGYALEIAQRGGKSDKAKPLKGFQGAHILEIVEDHASATWRAVYTVKSRRLCAACLSEEVEEGHGHAEAGNRLDQAPPGRSATACQRRQIMRRSRVTKSTGNVYVDLGVKNAEEHAIKAELVHQIAGILQEEHLTQKDTAVRLGIAQPDVSRMLAGHFRQFSVERLMRFLVALGQDVKIVVRPAAAARARAAQLTVSKQD